MGEGGKQLTSQPIGLFLLLAMSSISFQSRFATSARSLEVEYLLASASEY